MAAMHFRTNLGIWLCSESAMVCRVDPKVFGDFIMPLLINSSLFGRPVKNVESLSFRKSAQPTELDLERLPGLDSLEVSLIDAEV